MKQTIGNIGLLDLRNATEESIKGIERINNVGIVFYTKENAHLLSSLSIGNIGKSLEIPKEYSFINGSLTIDRAFLSSLKERKNYFINGVVIIDKDVTPDLIKKDLLNLEVNGAIYCPSHLSGLASNLFSTTTGGMVTYENVLPRFEVGEFTLTNSFLHSLDEAQHLVVAGVLRLSQDLNMELFDNRIKRLEVKGVISMHEEHEAAFHKKISSLMGCVLEVIPTGYQHFKKTLRVNERSIRRFKQAKIFTKKPIILEKRITRAVFSQAFESFQTKSMVICHEEIEDLVYEKCNVLDTAVIPYADDFRLIEGDEHWSETHLQSLESPINIIVNGVLTLDADVAVETVKEKLAEVNVFGQIVASDKTILGPLQNLIALNQGEIKTADKKGQSTYLQNIGELAL